MMGLLDRWKTRKRREFVKLGLNENLTWVYSNLRDRAFSYSNKEIYFIDSKYTHNGFDISCEFTLRYKDGSYVEIVMETISYTLFDIELVMSMEDVKMRLEAALEVAVRRHNVNVPIDYNEEPLKKNDFYTELSNNINTMPKIQELENKLSQRDLQIDQLMQEVQDTNRILHEQSQVTKAQSDLMIDIKEQLNKIEELDTDVEQLKKNIGDIKRFSDKFEDCCVGAAQRLKDGSGRQYCDCGRTITPEVVAALQLSGMIA